MGSNQVVNCALFNIVFLTLKEEDRIVESGFGYQKHGIAQGSGLLVDDASQKIAALFVPCFKIPESP